MSSLPEDAWSKRVYENGWDAKQLLCHLASGGAVEMPLAFVRDPSAFEGTDFDIDKINAQEVAARQDKPVSELLSEIRDNCKREMEAIEAAPDDQLAKRITEPGWRVLLRTPSSGHTTPTAKSTCGTSGQRSVSASRLRTRRLGPRSRA